MAPIIPGPAYRIVTRRLVLRCWQPTDAPLFKAAIEASREHLLPWMPWAENEPTDLQAKIDLLRRFRGEFDLGQDFVYGVFNRDETQVLGGTGLHTRGAADAREIGYWIHVDYIGQGLATELSAALTKVAFEVDQVKAIEICCDAENVRSAAVPRKLGYTLDATHQRDRTAKGLRTTLIWSLLAEEYPASPSADVEIAAYDAIGRKIFPADADR
jgi:RimJ/RimL family protein N-acetyltransferase